MPRIVGGADAVSEPLEHGTELRVSYPVEGAGTPLENSAADYLANLRAVAAIYESAAAGQRRGFSPSPAGN